MAGCQSTMHYKYDENDSRALNYAKVGNISGVYDAELPKDTVDKINSGVLSGALHGTVGYLTASTINLTDATGLILGFLSGITEAKNPAERTALFALMPSDLAEDRSDAAKKMTLIMEKSITNALNELGPETYELAHNPYIKNSLFFLYGSGGALNCPYYDKDKILAKNEKGTSCSGAVNLQKPLFINVTESEWLTTEPSVYFFSAGKGHLYNRIVLDPKGNKAQTGKLMALLSKHLPEWAYIYVAPKDLLDDDGEQIEYPYILNQGQAHYFVKAASNS